MKMLYCPKCGCGHLGNCLLRGKTTQVVEMEGMRAANSAETYECQNCKQVFNLITQNDVEEAD